MLGQIHDAFGSTVSNELQALERYRGYSLTHIASEATYLAAPITNIEGRHTRAAVDPNCFARH